MADYNNFCFLVTTEFMSGKKLELCSPDTLWAWRNWIYFASWLDMFPLYPAYISAVIPGVHQCRHTRLTSVPSYPAYISAVLPGLHQCRHTRPTSVPSYPPYISAVMPGVHQCRHHPPRALVSRIVNATHLQLVAVIACLEVWRGVLVVSCWGAMCCIAVICDVLPIGAVLLLVLWCDVMCCDVVWHDALPCGVTWGVVLWCDVIWSPVLRCDVLSWV